MVEKCLDGFDKLFGDSVKQRVTRFYAELQQQLHHLEVLVVDGHKKRRAAERINAVHVNVMCVLGALQHAPRARHIAALHAQQELLLLERQHRHLLVRPHHVLLLCHTVDTVPLRSHILHY